MPKDGHRMRSDKSPENFFSKMKKKPAVQKVIDNIDDYSIEELENLKGSQFPKWIRKVLIKYKHRNGKTSEEMATNFAIRMTKASLDNKD